MSKVADDPAAAHGTLAQGSQPLMPIARMQKGLIALLARQANEQRVRVLLKNGLKLNEDGNGSIGVDLEKALAYNEAWEKGKQ